MAGTAQKVRLHGRNARDVVNEGNSSH